MKSSLSLFISSTVILISLDCDLWPAFFWSSTALRVQSCFHGLLSLTGVSVRLALQLWLTSACCRVVVIQLWFSCSTFSITYKQLLPLNPLIQTTKTPHTAPRYPILIINWTNPLMGRMKVKWVKCTHSSLVSWFGSIWSDKWTKTASCYLDDTQNIFEVFWNHSDSFSFANFYLTIQTNFFFSQVWLYNSQFQRLYISEFWVLISEFSFFSFLRNSEFTSRKKKKVNKTF